ncbi:MAG: hypothetical protein ABUL72_02615, partial [Armatimonadota bacterium]
MGAALLAGCAGSGSMASNDTSRGLVGGGQTEDSGQTWNVIVPQSSMESDDMVGRSVHTNHLISDRPVSRATSPQGLSVAQVRSAYGVPSSGGSGGIAIVDAYHYPTALNDFNVFSNQYSLPTETSTSATSSSNTHFQVVYASGSQPATDTGWAQEAALDIEWAHAMAPGAKVYLVEAASSAYTDMMAAVNVAKTLPGVKQVSMSFGGTEASSLYTSYNNTFLQNGVAFFASGGDTGGQRSFPALSVNCVAVGGTSLHMSGTTYTSEAAWSGTGCGLSSFQSRPSFQSGVTSVVGTKRGGDDIAAIADPNTGVSVYDITASGGLVGWLVFGGTSVACPVVAGIANASGAVRASSNAQNTAIYAKLSTSSF